MFICLLIIANKAFVFVAGELTYVYSEVLDASSMKVGKRIYVYIIESNIL